ncbi:hypothetical protein [Nonomuraea sp. SYSU D8015]|uniref:hypothetical protein n=1 Tax=Nonomuraea sp. SYSU D8015 TaxID=2593644 RepID=UPI0016600849|nr:hypothetical protein [Nonomuraea sp. SYSU D8015]
MFRLLAVLAAVTPAVLSLLTPGESCGYFAYTPAAHEFPGPSVPATVVWTTGGWGADLLPMVLAMLALWAPRRFPVLGASMSAAVLLLGALTIVIPYTSPCGPQSGEWPLLLCYAIAIVACLLDRDDLRNRIGFPDRLARVPGRPVRRATALAWTAVLFTAFGLDLAATMPVSSTEDLGCHAELKDTWALVQMHLFTAEAVGVWVGVAAIGAVLVRGPAALSAALALLVPALYEPAAQLASSAPHGCSGTLELIAWPYGAAAALGVAACLAATVPVRREPS